MKRFRPTESGGASAELVVATPLLLLLIFGIVQFALWQHASHIVEAAAQEGARSARLQGGTVESGKTETYAFLNQLGPNLVLDPQVSVTRDNVSARVEVDAHVESVVPHLTLPVHAISSGPVERFVPQGSTP